MSMPEAGVFGNGNKIINTRKNSRIHVRRGLCKKLALMKLAQQMPRLYKYGTALFTKRLMKAHMRTSDP